MSVRPNFIPRTLIGVGGVRLFDIPGVIYPEEMLKAQHGVRKKNGQPFKKAPAWGISTKEAAAMLGCSRSATRLALHKLKVEYRVVVLNSTRQLYWRKSEVEKVVCARLPEMRGEGSQLVDTKGAVKILGIARSTLHRYIRRGKLKAINVRYVPDAGPARNKIYFAREEVMALDRRMNAEREWERRKREAMAQLE